MTGSAQGGRLRADRVVLGIVALYAVYLITRVLLLPRLPIFWDEAFHAVEAQTGLDDPAQRFQFVADGKPPLFNWISIVLVQGGLEPLTAVRVLSVLAGLVTLTAVLLLGRWLAGTAAMLIGGTLYVLSPIALVHDTYGLIDGLFTACAMAALCLQVRLARQPTALTAIGAGVAVGAAILTRQVGYLSVLLLPVGLLALDWRPEGRRARLLRWTGGAVLAAVVGLALSVLLKLAPYDVIATPRQNRTVSAALEAPFENVGDVWAGFHGTMTAYVGWMTLVLALLGLVFSVIDGHSRGLLLAAWVCAPIALVFLLLTFGFPRYFLSAVPPLLVLAAGGAVGLGRLLRSRLDGRALAGGRVVLASLVLAGPTVLAGRILVDPDDAPYPSEDRFQLVAGWPAGTGLERIKDVLDRAAGPGTTVVAGAYFTPWNLAVQFDHPVRIPIGAVPYADGVRVRASGGRVLEFYPSGTPQAANPQFVLQHDVFGPPPGIDLADYHLIASYARPAGSTLQGKQQPVTMVQLFARN